MSRRVRTPTVLQMEAVECGAACLGMVLGSYGLHLPLETLRHACGVSRDGTSAASLIRAARRYGMAAKGFSVEPDDLRGMPLPLIVFWNFNHFVVVEGFGRNAVHINDPATGPRKVTLKEFDEAFTGVALTFEPGPEFAKGGRPRSVWRGLLRRLRGSGEAVLFVALAGLALVLPGLLVPAFARIFVDDYLVQGYRDWLTPLLLGMVGAAALRAVLSWLQRHSLTRLQTKLAVSGASRFLWHVLRLPIGFFAQRFGGEVAARMAFNERLARVITGELAITLVNLLTMAAYAAIMAQYDWVLAAIALAFAVLNLGAFALLARRLADGSQKLLLDQGKLAGVTMQGLQMIESFKASGAEDLLFSRWAGHHAKVVNSEQALSRARLFLNSSPILLSMLGSAAILVVGGFRVMDGAITIGTLVAFQTLMASFSAPVTGLVQLGGQLQEAEGDITRLDDVLAHDLDEVFQPSTGHPAPAPALAIGIKLTGRLQVRDLTFGFIPTGRPLIENFSLDLAPGSRVALVGPSGSGKSTIGKLIAGLYRPWNGDILFDGMPIAAIPRRLLRNSLAMVDQDVTVFQGRIDENISLWDPTMPEERIVEAARDAALHAEIAERPLSYAHPVAEGGRNLSGGQRQRLEIARALATDPSILILDEATSALDPVMERTVMENIRLRGCSCLIIAHRLSTIRDCDEIIVLDQGKVMERGSHPTLLAQDGLYRRLIEA